MRTDSTRISEEARAAAKVHIENTYGEEYYENRYYKTNKDAQDAHEAIRPTYIDLTPDKIKESLTNDQYKLYRLIYNRFIASQMAAAIFDTMLVKINANEYNFRANGQTIRFKGFMTFYVETEDNEQKEEFAKIPPLTENQELQKENIETIDEPCPKCGGKVQIRKTKKRRNYYICENNPNNGCDYISWTKPVKEKKEK